jgi:SAM-dependent methyltransferase
MNQTTQLITMREVTWQEYEEFLRQRGEVVIEDVRIPLTGRKQVAVLEPTDFEPEQTTVWSFPDRGTWATHQGNYRGNWAPQIPRNLILRYTQPGEWVLDPMVGSGTTLVECKLLGRNGIGVDINYEALMLTFDRLNFEPRNLYETLPPTEIRLYHGDARNLDKILDESIDLIATHPPYANIIAYSKGATVNGDLSRLRSLDEYLDAMTEVAKECYRVLKPGRHCAILVGDTRRHKHYVPIAFHVMERFLKVGFILREDVIKVQWKMKSTRERWQRQPDRDFLLIYHEHLFIFRKPAQAEDTRKLKDSMAYSAHSSSSMSLSSSSSSHGSVFTTRARGPNISSPSGQERLSRTTQVPSSMKITTVPLLRPGSKSNAVSPLAARTSMGLFTITLAFRPAISVTSATHYNSELCACKDGR